MQNATKVPMPSDKEVEKLVRQIKAVNEAFKKYAINLSTYDRKHLLRPRRGGQTVSALLTTLATERKLQVAGATGGEIDDNRTRAMRLTPLRTAAAALAQSLDDTILQAESNAWRGTAAIYSALQGVARSDGTLKDLLEPATSFFSTGRRKSKTPPAAK